MNIFFCILSFLILFTSAINSPFALNSNKTNQLLEHVKNNNFSELESLIKSGANVDQLGNFGETPLMQAIYLNNNKAAKLLLQYGANPNASDMAKVTPLHIAARVGNLELADLLVKSGAQINCLDKYNMTPLMKAVAAHKNKVLEFLIDKGAITDNKDIYGYDPITIAKKVNNTQALNIFTQQTNFVENQNIKKLSSFVNEPENDNPSAEIIPVNHKHINNMDANKTANNEIKKVELLNNTDTEKKEKTIISENENNIIMQQPKENNNTNKIVKHSSNEIIKPKKHIKFIPRKISKNNNKKKERVVIDAEVKNLNAIYLNMIKSKNESNVENQNVTDLEWLGNKQEPNQNNSQSIKMTEIKTKKTTIKLGKAKIVDKNDIDDFDEELPVDLTTVWVIAGYKNQYINYGIITQKSFEIVQDYSAKYQIIQNLKNNKRYIKIGPILGKDKAENICEKIKLDQEFDGCKVIKH